jgi:hypothetical protein
MALSDYRLQYLFLSRHTPSTPPFCMPTLAGSSSAGNVAAHARHRMAETLVAFDMRFGNVEGDEMSRN